MLYVSPSVRRLLGHEQRDLEGRLVYDFVPAEEVEGLRGRFAQALEIDAVGRPVEFHLRHRETGWRLMEGVGRRVPGAPSQLIVNVRDITDYRRAEHAQQETEER